MFSKVFLILRVLLGLAPVAKEVVDAVKQRQVDKARQKADRWIFGTMLAFGIAGLISAFVLTVEKFHLLENPDAVLSCTFNVILNCATVMQTPQASVFGFPNSLLGLMGYAVVITVAVAGLCKVRFPRAFMAWAQVGFTLGLIFAYWLFFQSVYVIQVLCPWCLVVTFSTTMIYAALKRYNVRENNLYLTKNLHKKALRVLQSDYDKLIVAGWLALMIFLVLFKFQNGLFL